MPADITSSELRNKKPLPPIDDSVKIPKAVRAQSQKADEIHAANYKKDQPDTLPKDQVATPPQFSEAAQVIPAPSAPPADVPAPAEATPPTPPPAAPEAPKDTNWEHAYKSMKGRYERTAAQLREVGGQLNNLQTQVDELKRAPQRLAPEQTFEVPSISSKELEDYGPDLIELVGKKAKLEFLPVVSQLQEEVKQLKTQLAGTRTEVVADARARMINTLDEQLPQWRDLDSNEEFLDWLALPDQYSGVIRQVLLRQAFEQNHAPRVLAFFQGFLAEEAASTPARATLDPPPARVPAVQLETLAAPGRAKSTAGDPPPVEKPIIQRADIAAFYADVRRGKYRGKEAEKQQIDQMISDAARDGRIR